MCVVHFHGHTYPFLSHYCTYSPPCLQLLAIHGSPIHHSPPCSPQSIQPAIQLDISDQRKVRIHLNRTLIRKVLEEHKRVSTLQQTAKPSRGGSSRRLKTDTDARNAMMLPIHSIVRILPGIAEHPSARESRDLGGGGEGDDDEVRLSQL